MNKLILIEDLRVPLKMGDTVWCKPGFKRKWDSDVYSLANKDMTYGGGGYREYRGFVIGRIDYYKDGRDVAFPIGGGSGIYADALTLVKRKDD